METILNESISLIRDVGSYILTESKKFTSSSIEHKGLNDLVSYVDKTAEEKLVQGLKSILPEAGFITEEGTNSTKKEEYNWIIDPLDGTTNFVHGLPIFAISVALMQQDELVLGVVYEINKDECFYASKGKGAFLNKKKISVSPITKLSDSLLATGFPYYEFSKMEKYLNILNDLMQNTHGLRRMGSAAVDLAYVACGRFEGFFEYNLNAWDVAAGALIVQEAGGKVTNFSGEKDYVFGREIIATGCIHNKLTATIQKYWNN